MINALNMQKVLKLFYIKIFVLYNALLLYVNLNNIIIIKFAIKDVKWQTRHTRKASLDWLICQGYITASYDMVT